MAKVAFTAKKLKPDTLALIVKMNRIVDDYLAQGLNLTLRQLYYRLVAADEISNTQKSYDRVGQILSDARLNGLTDWGAIEDRERSLSGWRTWSDVSDYLRSVAWGLRYDHWRLQDRAVEVWVEKKALLAIVTRACSGLRADHFACKGYVSQSALYRAAQRIERRYKRSGQETTILYLGDHDPSGLDMPGDIGRRLNRFRVGHMTTVDRIALTKAQIREYDPPPNPAKVTDARYKKYRDLHGEHSWELDALEPRVLTSLIQERIDELIDASIHEGVVADERSDSNRLHELARSVEDHGWSDQVSARSLKLILQNLVESGDLDRGVMSNILGSVGVTQ